MGNMKKKFNNWLGKEQKPVPEQKAKETPAQTPAPEPAVPAPEPVQSALPPEIADWEKRQAGLLENQAESQRKLARLSSDLSASRKSFQEELRRKEEDKVRLLAQISLSDNQTQTLLSEQRMQFEKSQTEAKREIEILDQHLAQETVHWTEKVQEMQRKQEEFLSTSELKTQEKEIARKRREQELERSNSDLQAQIERIESQITAEKKEFVEQIRALDEEIVSLRGQIQLKETNRRLQEQKAQQDLAQSRQEWENKVRELETRVQQERQKAQEEYAGKESEFLALRFEQERREVQLRYALEQREGEINSLKSRADSKLKAMEESARKSAQQFDADLKTRREETEKLRVELVLLESQLKVDSERSESMLIEVQKEAAGRISALEKQIQEEIRAGEKTVSAKQDEIQALEMQFDLKKTALENEFNQKKAEIERQKKELQEKIKSINQQMEQEREDHRSEITRRDELINSLKQQMNTRVEELRVRREEFNVQSELKKQELGRHLSELDEKCRQDRQSLLNRLADQGKLLSERKAALAREQALLQHTHKKQEDQLQFEVQPLKNQSMDLRNRLEQERASRGKVIHAKEEILKNLSVQKTNLESHASEEQKQFDTKKQEDEKTFSDRLKQMQEKWSQEKVRIDADISTIEKERMELESQIALLPGQAETELARLNQNYSIETQALKKEQSELSAQLSKEQSEFDALIQDYGLKQSELEQSLREINLQLDEQKQAQTVQLETGRSAREKTLREKEVQIETRRKEFVAKIEAARKNLESAQSKMAAQQAAQEQEKSRLEKQWSDERFKLEEAVSAISKEYDSQKVIWQRAVQERTTQIEDLQKQIDDARARHDNAVNQLKSSRTIDEEQFQQRIAQLENEHRTLQEESAARLKEKKSELNALETALETFTSESRQMNALRKTEITEQTAELENQRTVLEKQLESDTQRWPAALSEKESEISFLKSVQSLKEAEFRAEWERSEKEFEQFKKTTADRIQELQKAILSEHNQVEFRIAELEKEIVSVQAKRTREEESDRALQKQFEDEFAKVSSTLNAEIEELEKKRQQEKSRFEQLIRVREIELDSIRKNLDQRETQRHLASEARLKEISQERARLTDWQRALNERLEKEKSQAEKTLSSKNQELVSLKEKIALQDDRHKSEQSSRQEEILKERTRLNFRVQELSKQLEEESGSYQHLLKDKHAEMEQLQHKLNLWTQTVKAEEEKERAKWDEERIVIEEKVKDLEAVLSRDRTETELIAKKQSEDAARLTDELTRVQQAHQAQIAEFKKQKSEMMSEEDRWERKIKEERLRIEDESRQLDKDIERVKVDLSLKETQFTIEKQKRDRENRWAKRPLDAKLADLKRRWEEKERDRKRKQEIQQQEQDRIANQIRKTEEALRNEADEQKAAVTELKISLETRLKDLKERFSSETGSTLADVSRKKQEIETLRSALKEAAGLAHKISLDDSAGLELKALESEIKEWEQKLLAAPADSDETARASSESMKQELSDLTRNLAKEKMTTDNIREKAKSVSDRLNAEPSVADDPDARERASQARGHVESGISAYSMEKFQEALVYFNQALAVDPKLAVCYQMKGLIAERQGDKNAAKRDFVKSLELDPTNEFLRNHLKEIE